MTDHIAPQEDQLILPPAWAARLPPWRGRRAGKTLAAVDPERIERCRRRIAEHEEELRAALANPENQRFASAGNRFLDGIVHPRGAAVVAALAVDVEGRANQSWLRPEFEIWVQDHGLPFAAAAAVEYLVLQHGHGYYADERIKERTIRESPAIHPEVATWELWRGGIAAVRSALAAASDDEYAAAVAAVADHRITEVRCVVAMLLFPGEDEWVLKGSAVYGSHKTYASENMVLWHSISRPEHAAAAKFTTLKDHLLNIEIVAPLIGGMGADALPILLATARTARYYTEADKLLHRAIALLPSDEATEYVLERLDRPQLFDVAAEAADHYPLRTLRVAARLAPNATAELRRPLTLIVSAVDPELHRYLDETDRAVIDELLTGTGRVPEADPEDLPPLLVAPPWTRKGPKPKPTVIEGLEPPAESHLLWAEGEREAWGEVRDEFDLDEEYWRDEPTIAPDDWRLSSFLGFAEIDRAEKLLGHWTGEARAYAHADLQRVLARFGERVVDRVLVVPGIDHTHIEFPGPILNAAAARIAAERLTRLKAARPHAAEWFDRHGLATVPYLVPDALGADKKRRRYAEYALARLADRHGTDAVAAQAETFSAEAAEAIRAHLGSDPLVSRAVKIPKPGPWAAPVTLPQVLLKGEARALPTEAIPHLITVLALGTPDVRYAGVDVVAEICDRASLIRFSRALFEQWLAVGGPAKDGWALTQLMHFADDATVWDLAALVSAWPGESQHKRAVTGLEVLGAIGTEEALRAMQSIADKVKFKALKEEAGRQIARIAAGLGLSREQLADRLVPEFGLGEAKALEIDYGPRKFTVVFDEHLKPCVTDETGALRKTLPKPGAKDDPEIAEDSYKRFAALKKELRSVAADQVRRIEAAMVSARDWSPEEFRRFFVDHALTWHLARRLVWIAETDGEPTGFRIAEDGTLGDIDDEAVEIPETARVRVAHPAHLGPEATKAWAGLFADYEILQPFEQLNRPVLAFTEGELATGRLTRFEGVKVEVGRLLGMTNRGWRRAAPEDAGMAPGISYPLPGGGFVTVALDPGIYAGNPGEFPQQTLCDVRLAVYESYYWSEKEEPGREFPTGIDPLTASEILAALTRLTA